MTRRRGGRHRGGMGARSRRIRFAPSSPQTQLSPEFSKSDVLEMLRPTIENAVELVEQATATIAAANDVLQAGRRSLDWVDVLFPEWK